MSSDLKYTLAQRKSDINNINLMGNICIGLSLPPIALLMSGHYYDGIVASRRMQQYLKDSRGLQSKIVNVALRGYVARTAKHSSGVTFLLFTSGVLLTAGISCKCLTVMSLRIMNATLNARLRHHGDEFDE